MQNDNIIRFGIKCQREMFFFLFCLLLCYIALLHLHAKEIANEINNFFVESVEKPAVFYITQVGQGKVHRIINQ